MTPSEVGEEFVLDNTEHSKLAAHLHTIVWGSRGSGKSMHFRFLEPAAWIAHHAFLRQERTPHDEAYLVTELANGNAAIGVYVNCRDAALSRSEFRLLDRELDDPYLLHLLTDRYLAVAVMQRICETLLFQLPSVCKRPFTAATFPEAIRAFALLDCDTLADALLRLTGRARHSLADLGALLESWALRTDSGDDDDRLRDVPRLTLHIEPFLRSLQEHLGITAPFFLMFDEANELSPSQQQVVSELLAQRSQRVLCVKVASQLNGFSTQRSVAEPPQELHDYTAIDLDSLYTNNRDAYYSRVQRIANERLERAGLAGDIQKYLPPNRADLALMEEARRMAAARYDALPPDRRPIDRANYVRKYAPAIVHQELRSPKAGKSYAGFDNVVHLSSGIVRAFLDCCSNMYTNYMESGDNREPESIPVDIQNATIEDFSDAFIESEIIARLAQLDAESDESRDLRALYNLLRGLGTLFRLRLHDKDSSEPRIISVSVKDVCSTRLGHILSTAVQRSFLHKRWYRSKRGTVKLPCYILNRRLCPHFNLEISGFQGRLEMVAVDLELALDDPDKFASTMMDRSRTLDADDSGEQISLWEW